jgi:hypothetical protein
MLKINGVAISTPKTFKVTINDLDGESNRNAKGELMRDRVAVKRKIECEWPPLTMPQISTLLKALQDVFFSIEYPDPMEGAFVTKTFYVGDRAAPVFQKKPDGTILWESVSMNFIEK